MIRKLQNSFCFHQLWRSLLSFFLSAFFFINSLSQSVSNDEKYFFHKNDFPYRGRPEWVGVGEDPQGIAHDSLNWYISLNGSLYKIPLSVNINQSILLSKAGVRHVTMDPLLQKHYDHIGDIVNYNHEGKDYLLLPLTGSKDDKYRDSLDRFGRVVQNNIGVPIRILVYKTPSAIAVYSAADLKFIDYDTFPNFKATKQQNGAQQQRDAGWCAVMKSGELVSSNDNTNSLEVYSIEWKRVAIRKQLKMTWQRRISLSVANGAGKLHNMQGGEFSTNGEVLYLSCGIMECATWTGFGSGEQWPTDGLHVFDALSKMDQFEEIETSKNGSGCFNFQFSNNCDGDEPEGLTVWDLNGNNASNISGQLHVILLNHAIFSGDDVVSLKHYTRNDPGSNIFSSHQTVSEDKRFVFQYPVLTGDVNGDGRTDLIFEGQDWGGNTNLCVRVKLGNLDGTFTELRQQNFGDGSAVHQYPVLTGDVNGDGRTDLIFEGQDWGGNTNLCVRVKLGNPDGTFTELRQQNFGDGSAVHQYPVLTGDVNGDGRTDLIFEGQDWGGNTNLCVRVKLGNPDGTFIELRQQNFGDGNAVHQYPVLTGDVNGDGRTDLIFEGQDWGGNTNLCVRVKLGNLDGTFAELRQQNFGDGSAVHQYPVLTGDVNGDGRTDLIFEGQDWGGNTNLCVRVKLGNPDGTFTELRQQNFGDGNAVHQYPVLTGDINGDGRTDLIFVGKDWTGCGLNIRVKISNSDGTWCEDRQIPGDGSFVLTYPVLVGDINNDHKTDLIFTYNNAADNLVIKAKVANSKNACTTQGPDAGIKNLPLFSLSRYIIYPNPTSTYFMVRTSKTQIVQIRLMNAQGIMIRNYPQFNTDVDRIDVSLLQNGFYFIQIFNPTTGESVSKRVIKSD